MSVALDPSKRAQDLNKTADGYANDASRNWEEAKQEAALAGEFSVEAGKYALKTVGHALGGTSISAALGAGAIVVGSVEAAAATAVGVAAVPVFVAEELQDGATGLVNGLAKGLANLANAIKDWVARGGTRAEIEVTPGNPDAARFSDAMIDASAELYGMSGDAFVFAAKRALGVIGHAILAGENFVYTAANAIGASAAILAAAKDTGDAAALTAAEKAVRLAAVAVEVAEEGTYAAAAAMTAAAQALSTAASAVNSARGDDVKIKVVAETPAAA